MREAILLLFFVHSFLTHAQFKIVTIGEGSGSVSPSVSINRRNPANFVVTCADGAYASDDEGTTWKRYETPGMKGSAEHRLISDRKGELFDFFIASNPDTQRYDKIICQSSNDGGRTWITLGTIAVAEGDIRYPRVCIYNKSGEFMLTWTQYDKWGSGDKQHQSNIMHAVSKDGKKWSKPLRVNQLSGDCLDQGSSPKGAMPAINTKEMMFVIWAMNNMLYIDRSFNKGVTWLTNDIHIADQPGGWSYKVPGMSMTEGLPEFHIDNSTGRYSGALFLSWADQRNGVNDTDIWFQRSVNFGDNWTTPLRVNDDAKGRHQFSPAMTIDQTDGTIYIIYHDRRNYDDERTDLYLAYSTDNGTSFSNVRITEDPVLPASNGDFNNYISLDANKGTVIPVWTSVVNGKTLIQTTLIRRDDLLKTSSEK
jgi:hypothetical protein